MGEPGAVELVHDEEQDENAGNDQRLASSPHDSPDHDRDGSAASRGLSSPASSGCPLSRQRLLGMRRAASEMCPGRLEIVGRGGMGEVWSGRDLRLGRNVAVKLLSSHMASQPGVRERSESEARSAARLSHPNVVLVFDSGEHEGTPYLVMELLPGRTLADEETSGPLDAERVCRLGIEVLDALAASHQAGILHRDIKPGQRAPHRRLHGQGR